MDLAEIRSLVAQDMRAVDDMIQRRLHSDVALINQLGGYIVNSGGKRLRPLVVLLTARAAGYRGDRHIPLAAIVELIHTATLLHDDVVDASDVRRGRDTANHIWGNEATVLVGDFLYTRSFQMMVELDSMAAMETFARATNTIAEGEVLQLLNIHDADINEARYREVIYRKTAVLFEAGCQLAAGLAGQDGQAAANYGRHLGTAFQLIDDALDYDGDPATIGKNLGDDLAEGKSTMPLIRAMQTGDLAARTLIREAIEAGDRKRIDSVREAIASTDAIAYTRHLASDEARMAKTQLTFARQGPLQDALTELAWFAADRNH